MTEQQLRDQLETDVFGAVWVTQAALPYLREVADFGIEVTVIELGGFATRSARTPIPSTTAT